MEIERMPKPGEIFRQIKDKPYQVITVATHSLTGESMVVYQLLYGDFKTYVKPLSIFLNEMAGTPSPKAANENEIRQLSHSVQPKTEEPLTDNRQDTGTKKRSLETAPLPLKQEPVTNAPESSVSNILIQFLDASSYSKKLEIITTNTKHLNDRLINDMAVSLDCTVEDGPLDKRIQELIFCLQAMRRFEDRRLR